MKIRHRQTRKIRHAELVELLATYGEISPTAAKRLAACWVTIITSALSFGHRVQIARLGTLEPIAHKPHKAFDTQRLAAESYRIRFSASPALLKSMKGTERFRNARTAYRQPRPDTQIPSEASESIQD